MESAEMLKGMEIGAETVIENRKIDVQEDEIEAEKLLEGIKLGNQIVRESTED
jgi:hypothetical protein